MERENLYKLYTPLVQNVESSYYELGKFQITYLNNVELQDYFVERTLVYMLRDLPRVKSVTKLLSYLWKECNEIPQIDYALLTEVQEYFLKRVMDILTDKSSDTDFLLVQDYFYLMYYQNLSVLSNDYVLNNNKVHRLTMSNIETLKRYLGNLAQELSLKDTKP
jgi:HEPN domain-containing protein